ncbi:hypothetical protein [Nocardioides immobilis]|uniref:hypothetical protein n=1 Tax=Nocardioides immobilis TaxID=2049295 RepID=UPI001C70EB42|nr:hypothetical protein [Nocardioides immobilis]
MGLLSNFAPHRFELDGVECASMEALLQAFKFGDPDEQAEIYSLVGSRAKSRGRRSTWVDTQTLWWAGRAYPRLGRQYQGLLDRAYAALAGNRRFAVALTATGDAELTHSRGQPDPTMTVLTPDELCSRLMSTRERLRATTA